MDRTAEEENRKLFVGRLPLDIKEQEIQLIFSTYGKVNDVYILQSSLSGKAASAFVTYETVEGAQAAVQVLDGVYKFRTDPACEPVKVSVARPRQKGGDKGGGKGSDNGSFGGSPRVAPYGDFSSGNQFSQGGGGGGYQAGGCGAGGGWNPQQPGGGGGGYGSPGGGCGGGGGSWSGGADLGSGYAGGCGMGSVVGGCGMGSPGGCSMGSPGGYGMASPGGCGMGSPGGCVVVGSPGGCGMGSPGGCGMGSPGGYSMGSAGGCGMGGGGACSMGSPGGCGMGGGGGGGKGGAPGRKLYVSNLPADITKEALQMVFGTYGQCEDIHVMQGRAKSGQSCAFVTYASPDHAVSAIAAIQTGYEIRPGEGHILVKHADDGSGKRSRPY